VFLIRPSLLGKCKALARELADQPADIQQACEPILDSFLLLLRSKKRIEDLRIDVLGSLGKLFTAGRK
jgi:hypothetical protein